MFLILKKKKQYKSSWSVYICRQIHLTCLTTTLLPHRGINYSPFAFTSPINHPLEASGLWIHGFKTRPCEEFLALKG